MPSSFCAPETREKIRKALTRHGGFQKRKASPEYSSWMSMFNRCYRPSQTSYKNYGGRGIGVCARWWDFALFLEDMGRRPEGKELDRVDTDKWYGPDNCRWSTRAENMRNRRNNRFVEVNGKRMTVAEAVREMGLNESTVRARIRRGHDPQSALR